MAVAGVNLRIAMAAPGHSDLSMTMGIYQHLNAAMQLYSARLLRGWKIFSPVPIRDISLRVAVRMAVRGGYMRTFPIDGHAKIACYGGGKGRSASGNQSRLITIIVMVFLMPGVP
jgi:hypothetical protein